MKLLQTTAWMQGRDIVEESDLSVLQHVLWQNPQDIKPVLRAILKMSNPVEQKVVDILDQLEEIEAQLRDEVKKAQADNTVEGRHELREQAIEWWTKIEGLMRGLRSLRDDSIKAEPSTEVVDGALAKGEEVGVLIGSEAMGLDRFNKARRESAGLPRIERLAFLLQELREGSRTTLPDGD